MLFEDRRFSWAEVDGEVNRAARALLEMGVRKGDVVALLMDNRPQFLFAITGLNRIGAAGALINTNLTGQALTHGINVSGAKLVLVGSEHLDTVLAVLRTGPPSSSHRAHSGSRTRSLAAS